MPSYDYKCPECGTVIEKFHNFTINPAYKCPKCNKKMVRQIGRGAAVIFKGTGFYETDYKKKEK